MTEEILRGSRWPGIELPFPLGYIYFGSLYDSNDRGVECLHVPRASRLTLPRSRTSSLSWRGTATSSFNSFAHEVTPSFANAEALPLLNTQSRVVPGKCPPPGLTTAQGAELVPNKVEYLEGRICKLPPCLCDLPCMDVTQGTGDPAEVRGRRGSVRKTFTNNNNDNNERR